MQRRDTLLVCRLDRLGRPLHHLVTIIEDRKKREIGFRSVYDGVIDTTTPAGELSFHVFSALVQLER
ncbi:MAG: recombinase family protein [Planctomycetes bacterium]|nr:recombinase family protein [Planctomycetota bacterium]